MLKIQINSEFKDRIVSHGKVCAKPVGDHTQAELLELGIIARSSNNRLLLECFVDLPVMTDLVKEKTAADIKQVSDNTVKAAPEKEGTTDKK